MNTHWHYHYPQDQVIKDLEQLRQILLTNRGLVDAADQKEFFDPTPPSKLSLKRLGLNPKAISQAISRLDQARQAQETVVIYGDYDADGVCASGLMWQCLKQAGIKAQPFIPHRLEHGYGLSIKGLEEVIARYQPGLIITVDNGIVAHDAATYLAQNYPDIDLIITDHHQLSHTPPQAHSIVHTDSVCGAGVAWFFCRQFEQELKLPPTTKATLDLVALGTIADLMPMVGINRSLAMYGLKALTKSRRPGIVALKQVAGLTGEDVMTSYHVGYVLGPRINAMGRIGDGMDALRLLCTSSSKTAMDLASTLDSTNKQRQELTQEAVDRAILEYEQSDEHQSHFIVMVGEYHEGVIGLIAGKLVEKYHKPSLVISLNQSVSKGSARSVAGVNLVSLLRQLEDDLVGVGGHEAAAGLSIETVKLEAFIAKLKALAREQIDETLLHKQLHLECRLPLELVDKKLYEMLQAFAPFGLKNHSPVFASQATILKASGVGANHKHLKLLLEHPDGPLEALAFGQGDLLGSLEAGDTIDLAYTVSLNTWNGHTKVQLVVKQVGG